MAFSELADLLISEDRAAPEHVHVSFADRRLSLDDVDEADVVIFGVPFDGGTHTHAGTDDGPMGIRRAFRYFRTYSVELGIDVAEILKVADIGNIKINEWRGYDEPFAGIDAVVKRVAGSGKIPLMLGGDHSIAYPAIRAFAEVADGPIGVVWIDNHYDAWPPFRGDPFHCGCPLAHLLGSMPEKIAGPNVVHVGSRGYGNSAVSARTAAEFGVHVVSAGDVGRLGAQRVSEEAMRRAANGTAAVYVSVDLDAADLVFAPGTQSSRPGGLTSREMMTLVRECARRGASGFDIVECAPRADAHEATAMLGAELSLEVLGGVAATRTPTAAPRSGVDRREVVVGTAPTPRGHYSAAVKYGDLLFCSTQLPVNPASGEMRRGASEQAEQCLANLETVCRAGGTGLDRAVQLRFYFIDRNDLEAIDAAFAVRFQSAPPARTAVHVVSLADDALVSMEAVVECG